jgi:hypothetical protein
VKWSVSIVAEGDRTVEREEIVELADAVASFGGIASGIGAQHYGAQLLIEAGDRETAIKGATAVFTRAVAEAGLPPWPITEASAISEEEDQEYDE